MAARSKARKRAVDLLFEAEQRSLNVEVLMARRREEPEAQVVVPEFTVTLVEGGVKANVLPERATATAWSTWCCSAKRSACGVTSRSKKVRARVSTSATSSCIHGEA